MKTAKHFALVVLMVVGATLCATCPAQAATYALTPTGAEPAAAGQFTLSGFQLVFRAWGAPNYYYYEVWHGSLTVTCQGLTPGAWYSTSAGKLKADRNGNGSATDKQCSISYGFSYPWSSVPVQGYVSVSRINPDGSQTPVLVAPLPYPPN
jgi:hypothetical protein